MSHSLRCRLKELRYKGMITDREYERLCKALDNEPCGEMVHVETLHQVMWERDIACNYRQTHKGADRMTITKTCNTCKHYPNDKHCIGCEWDKSKGENTKWELKKNPIVIERKVLEQIRAEIERATIEMDYDTAKVALDVIDKHVKAEGEEG